MGLKGRAVFEPMEARILLSAAIPSVGGLFSTTAALHETHRHNAVAVVGDQALFGGDEYVGDATVGVAFDVSTGKVDTHTVPLFHDESSVVVSGGKVFFAGGRTQYHEAVSAVDIYDSAWMEKKVATPREIVSITALGDYAVFSGGKVSYAIDSDSADIFNLRTGNWSVHQLSAARGSIAIVKTGKTLYLVGDTKDYSSNGVQAIDLLNTATGNWSTDSLAAVRSGPTAALLGNQIIVTGRKSDADVGQDASENTADVYNPKTHTFHLLNLAGLNRLYEISSRGKTAILSSLQDVACTSTVDIVKDTTLGKSA